MKKIIVFLFFGFIFWLFLMNVSQNQTEKSQIQTSRSISKQEKSPTRKTAVDIKKKSIFIPYWSVSQSLENLEEYDRLFYFGVTGNLQGIVRNEAGYQNLETFSSQVENPSYSLGASPIQQSYLTLRMTNSDVNFAVLKNDVAQEKIISDAVDIAKKYKFNGILLDLEIFSILNDKIPVQINNFVQLLSTKLKAENFTLMVALYGDTFFRKRPFDVKRIGDVADEILIMAYDFHKAGGEPGPNFPLRGLDTYGYDFETMVNDFLQLVPEEKLTVVFGMYGYDWSVDEKKRPYTNAKALSLNEIKKNFFETCEWKNCLIKRDDETGETQISYVRSSEEEDEEGVYRLEYHIVWFEDEESVKKKTEHLQGKGIGGIAYWAYGYF